MNPTTLIKGKICRYFLLSGREIPVERVAQIIEQVIRYTWNQQLNCYELSGAF